MKVVDFNKMFIEREDLDLKIKQAGACKDEYKKLMKATTEYEYISVIQNNFIWFNSTILKQFDDSYNFYDGFARVKNDGKWGFLKLDGNMLTGFDFDFCSDFYDGFARVRKDDKYGYMKLNGDMLTGFDFDDCSDFYYGFSRVRKDDKYGYMKLNGYMLTGFDFDECYNFCDGFARVKNDGNWGKIDTQGNFTVDKY